jgi:cystathionine beta-lyase/cystathionine gamma-synthase
VLKLNVASVYFKCFKYFKCMLQVFHIDVTKVDRDVAHVAMVFSSVCPKCFICFKRMLQLFHLDVAKVDQDVVYACCKRMFQVF